MDECLDNVVDHIGIVEVSLPALTVATGVPQQVGSQDNT